MCGFLVTAGAMSGRPFAHRDVAAMRRRGPDGVGFWSHGRVRMAQTRLSVVGLDERSLAPLDNGRHVLVFNGEILNFLEVARELGCVPTSDTHVLLDGWTKLGMALLPKLDGFWSFAVYDRTANTVTLCRDQLGIKPLYYAEHGHSLVASSTLSPLLAQLLPHRPGLDTHVMSEWARYQLTTGRDTFLEGVKKVLPGEILEFDVEAGRITSQRDYERIWDVSGEARATGDWVREARELLVGCVDAAATSDTAVVSTCSGGLDSSLVTRLLEPELAFHGNFQDPDCNETQWARAAVDGTRSRLMVVNCGETFDLVERLDALVEDFDELAVGSAILPLDDVFGAVTRRAKVCLLGTGGDELFGGYARYGMALGETPSQESYHAAFAKLGPIGEKSAWQRFEACHVKGDTSLFRFYDPTSRTGFLLDNVGAGLGAMLAFDRRHFLGGLLTIDDRMGGRHGVEGRPALLHQRFVRKVLELDPGEMRGKAVLRRIARGILPDAIVDRPDKMGFTTPVGTIVNANASRIREALSGSRFRDLYNLRRLSFTAETKWSREIFGLMLLDSWSRKYA